MRSLPLLLLPLAAAWPGAARAAPPSPVIVAAPADPLGIIEAARRAAALRAVFEEAVCERDAATGEILVCGRRPRGPGMRVPWQPEPGARVRLIAGEAPGGVAAMASGRCLRLCQQPLMIDLIGGDRSIVNAIGRGIARLLHPD
jgi:hypothetical protein